MRNGWDLELWTLGQDLSQLHRQAQNFPDHDYLLKINVELEKMEVLLGELSISSERGLGLIRKSSKVANKFSSTVLYWARQHFLKMRNLSEDFINFQTRKMWIRLLQSRFTNLKGDDATTIEAQNLVDLVNRKQHLEAVEASLEFELDLLKDRRQELKYQYDAIGAADQNWNAANSFVARLGVSFEDSLDNPTMKSFEELLKVVSIPLRHPDENRKLTKLNKDLMAKSERLVTKCNHLASEYVKKGNSSVEPRVIDEFKNSIEHVSKLYEESSNAIRSLRTEKIAPSRPKIVLERRIN